MYTIEITLRRSASILAVQIKEEKDATQKFREIRDAIAQGKTGLLELSCEKTEKQVAVLAEEIIAAQLTPKSTTASSATTRPGFFAQLDREE